jgi:hypothetical protein
LAAATAVGLLKMLYSHPIMNGEKQTNDKIRIKIKDKMKLGTVLLKEVPKIRM